MSLMVFSNSPPLSFLSPLPTFSLPLLVASTVSRLHVKPIDLHVRPLCAVHIWSPIGTQVDFRVRASSVGADDASSTEDSLPPEESKVEASVPVNKLPLESKLKEMEEQKMKMRLAKKIRLRRKRLLRKRRMRKQGRWPPSKMKKLKNV